MSRSRVRVRPAEPADIPRLMRLGEATLPPGAIERRVGEAESQLAAAMTCVDRQILVATDEDSDLVVGFVVAYEDEVGAIVRSPALHVSHLVVDRAFRRRGIGRALLSACVHLAEHHGVEHILASAVSSSRDANRYLARLGFAPYVVRRITSTSSLRRALGLHDGDRLALIRRMRNRQHASSGGRLAVRPVEVSDTRRGA